MKGILGRKLGMTQLFSEHGRSIPVSVIQVQENVITQIFQKEKDGYNAVQLSTGNKRDKLVTKPLKGHFAKSNTKGKYFVKEIRNMTGYKLGDKVNASLFSVGELVDITGTSKGKGFQGNIKRHNQHIGPKSHGGGGGSQPVRQTGSIGDVVSNKVNKGMTMPGQMGNEKVTIQNLEIIFVDLENNFILVKGSIPGPKKSWLVIKESIKGLPKKDPQKLVDLKEIQLKNELLEKAKKVGAKVNTDMTIDEMEKIINVSLEDKENKEKNNG